MENTPLDCLKIILLLLIFRPRIDTFLIQPRPLKLDRSEVELKAEVELLKAGLKDLTTVYKVSIVVYLTKDTK